MDKLDEYITTSEAAEMCGVTPAALRRHARDGRFGARKRGGVWFLDRVEVERYAEQTRFKNRYDPTKAEDA